MALNWPSSFLRLPCTRILGCWHHTQTTFEVGFYFALFEVFAEHLLSIHKALGSIPGTAKGKHRGNVWMKHSLYFLMLHLFIVPKTTSSLCFETKHGELNVMKLIWQLFSIPGIDFAILNNLLLIIYTSCFLGVEGPISMILFSEWLRENSRLLSSPQNAVRLGFWVFWGGAY